MTVYYNENDPRAAEWLRELMRAGAIPEGVVDERSIEDIPPADVAGFLQCHFFAGIGGWAEALQLAGWPADRSVWTGSCPCQPYSVAGTRKGADDPRNLWPIWRWLIDQCRPVALFGEQVAGRDGRQWLTGVRADLDLLGYATGATDLCAAGVGSPQIRQRHWWVGYARRAGARWNSGAVPSPETQSTSARREDGRLDNSIVDAGTARGMGYSDDAGREGRIVLPERTDQWTPWTASLDNWIECVDGKARRIEPGIAPLADGIPGRVGLLRGYGNAIVPQVAATFIEAAMKESLPHRDTKQSDSLGFDT